MELTEYQRGISDLQDLFREYGAILFGEIKLKDDYHSFLKKNGLPIRRNNKKQREALNYLNRHLPPLTKAKTGTACFSIG